MVVTKITKRNHPYLCYKDFLESQLDMLFAETQDKKYNLSLPTIRGFLRYVQAEGALHTTRQRTNLVNDAILYYTDYATEEDIAHTREFYEGFIQGTFADLQFKKKEETKAQILGVHEGRKEAEKMIKGEEAEQPLPAKFEQIKLGHKALVIAMKEGVEEAKKEYKKERKHDTVSYICKKCKNTNEFSKEVRMFKCRTCEEVNRL